MSSTVTLSLARRVRSERLRLGFTQLDLARQSGVPLGSYARFERHGQVSLERLVSIAAAVGLSLQLSAADGVGAIANPLLRVRQRGVRHRPSPASAKPVPAAESAASTPAAHPPATRPKPSGPAPTRPSVDAAAVEAVEKQYRDGLFFLVRSIASSHLTNYTVATIVRNSMSSRNVPDELRPAYVAAAEAKLDALNSENCTAYGVTPAEFAEWQSTWNADLGIVGALD